MKKLLCCNFSKLFSIFIIGMSCCGNAFTTSPFESDSESSRKETPWSFYLESDDETDSRYEASNASLGSYFVYPPIAQTLESAIEEDRLRRLRKFSSREDYVIHLQNAFRNSGFHCDITEEAASEFLDTIYENVHMLGGRSSMSEAFSKLQDRMDSLDLTKPNAKQHVIVTAYYIDDITELLPIKNIEFLETEDFDNPLRINIVNRWIINHEEIPYCCMRRIEGKRKLVFNNTDKSLLVTVHDKINGELIKILTQRPIEEKEIERYKQRKQKY